jgi:hypothetical protein
MAEEIYVYSNPNKSGEGVKPKKSNSKLVTAVLALVAISCFAYFIYYSIPLPTSSSSTDNKSSAENYSQPVLQTYVLNDRTYDMPSVPSGYTSSQGMQHIKSSYASQLEEARILCTSHFGGDWVNTLDAIGCYNMKGFSMAFCGNDVIQGLIRLCYQIDGDNGCTDTEIYCAV